MRGIFSVLNALLFSANLLRNGQGSAFFSSLPFRFFHLPPAAFHADQALSGTNVCMDPWPMAHRSQPDGGKRDVRCGCMCVCVCKLFLCVQIGYDLVCCSSTGMVPWPPSDGQQVADCGYSGYSGCRLSVFFCLCGSSGDGNGGRIGGR